MNLIQEQKDLTKLKGITAEIKSITKQGAILIGQRVLEAKELLKPYRDGTFTLWLETTFGGRKSGYNALAYYELYIALPDVELKEKFKKISQRAAYLLASRRVDIGRKINIISKYFNLKTNELISVVQKEFAINDGRNISDGRNRKTMDVLLKHLLETVDRLVKRKKDLRRKDFDEVKYAQKRIQELLKE
ncbi:MAG: CT583 family protein [Ignavibacteriae bacterium]|nr:CT583 family protein [Ignavibacteriota bacterium]